MQIGSRAVQKKQEGIRRTRNRGTIFVLLDVKKAMEMARDHRKRGFNVKLIEHDNIALLMVK